MKALFCAVVFLLAIAPAYGQFKKVTSYYDEFCKNSTGGYYISNGPGCRDSLVGCAPDHTGLYNNDECFDTDPFTPNTVAGTVYQYVYDSSNNTCSLGSQGFLNVLVAPSGVCFSAYLFPVASYSACTSDQVTVSSFTTLAGCLSNENNGTRVMISNQCTAGSIDTRLVCGGSSAAPVTPSAGPCSGTTPTSVQSPSKKTSSALCIQVSVLSLAVVLSALA